MNRQVSAFAGSRRLIGALAAVLFGIFGITAGMAWVPGLSAQKETAEAAQGAVAAPENAMPQPEVYAPRGRCMECGVVESRREILTSGEADGVAHAVDAGRTARQRPDRLVRNYVLTVRMKDGARRELVQSSSADWQPGERVILIRGRTDD